MAKFQKAETLKVGQIYSDVPSDDFGADHPTYFKFLGIGANWGRCYLFQVVAGRPYRTTSPEGLTPFPVTGEEVSEGEFSYFLSPWYIPTPEILKQI